MRASAKVVFPAEPPGTSRGASGSRSTSVVIVAVSTEDHTAFIAIDALEELFVYLRNEVDDWIAYADDGKFFVHKD